MFGVAHAEEKRVDPENDVKLLELQSNIRTVERKLRLTETEKLADKQERKSNIKENDLEIKRLKIEVKELAVLLERSQKADEGMILEEFQKHSLHLESPEGKSAKEVIRQLESEALELQRRSKSLSHELELKARMIRHDEEQIQEMVANCDACFESEPTEYHSLQYIRELENEQQKIGKFITENEISENVWKQMKSQLEKNHLSNALLLEMLEREFLEERTDALQTEAHNTEPKKEVRFLEDGKLTPLEQESELLRIKADMESIKEATGVLDIKEADNRFLEQKSCEEKLSDLKKLFGKTLLDLKAEQKQLRAKAESCASCAQKGAEDELSVARACLKEQERRKGRTALELEKTDTLVGDLTSRMRKMVQSITERMPHLKMTTNENVSVLELEGILRKLEKILTLKNSTEI